jgi:hypothetical protein
MPSSASVYLAYFNKPKSNFSECKIWSIGQKYKLIRGISIFFLEQSVIFVYHILTFIEVGIRSVGIVASSSSSTTRERHRR